MLACPMLLVMKEIIMNLRQLPPTGVNLIVIAASILVGLVFKSLSFFGSSSNASSRFSFIRSVLRRLSGPSSYFFPLLTFYYLLPYFHTSGDLNEFIEKALVVALIVAFAFVLISLIRILEDFLYHLYDLNKADNLRERKIRTQIQFIRKLLIGVVIILAIGAILVSFSSLRRIGTGLLTGVGVSSIIVGFAAQKTLSNLLAGLQIAFTQPLRIDDVLVVEGEFGRVEEITLTYVVLNLWDQRRLILPITYFLEKPFQNWTRTSAEILATIFLYLDYCAPFDQIRGEFLRYIEGTELWDKRTASMQVTEATADSVQVRLVLSASNASRAFDLRCLVREHLLSYIQKNIPEALPKTRTIFSNGKNETLLAGQFA